MQPTCRFAAWTTTLKRRTFFKIFISFGLLSWFFSRTDLKRLAAILSDLSLDTLAIVLALYLIAWLVNTLKWKILLREYKYWHLFFLNMIGQFYALILPGQMAGEIVKAYKLIGQNKNGEKIVTSVILDRFTGVIGLLLVGMLGLFVSRTEISANWTGRFAAAILCMGIGAYMLNFPVCDRFLRKWMSALKETCHFTSGVIDHLMHAIDVWQQYLKKPGLIFQSVGLGVAFQLLGVCIIFFIARDIGITIKFSDWCWIFTAVSLILLLPISFGGVGLREGGFLMLLAMFGVSNESALACSLAFFALQVATSLLGGAFELMLSSRERTSADGR
jgi:uncharacterized protein (TIRG00374 family)